MDKPTKQRVKLITPHEAWRQRNTKITPEVLKIFEENLALGLPQMHCCSLAGISHDTFFRWLERGRLLSEAPQPEDDSQEQYLEFWIVVNQAQAMFQVTKLRGSLTSERFNPNWVRDMTMLERRDRKHWGRSQELDVRTGEIAPDEKFL